MLNTETKRRIDNARDILVGKVPDPKTQVEQITFAMIYKFMDDMDQLSERLGGKASFFANGYEQFAWSKLLDKKLSGADRMDLYVRALEGMAQNPFIPQLFRDVFRGAFLPYRDSETLNLFLKEINGFTYDHSEDLGDAYEYLLSIFATQGKAGQFRTPRHIIDFIVDCVDPDLHDTVLDPACGTAGFLISAYKHVLEKYKEDPLAPDQKQRLTENFVGYDISPDMVRLSRVNMYLHNFPNPTIYEYDTLTNEDRWDDTFDVILANPPFMTPKGGIRPHNRFAVRANRSEVLFVDYIAEHLNVGGRAGVIVPEGIIFQSSNAYKDLRKMLVEAGYLYAVVSLPAGVFNPYSGVKTSILLMDKDLARRADSVLFVKVEHDGYDLGAQRRAIEQDDLPEALRMIKAFQANPQMEPDNPMLGLTVKKERLGEDGDYNLSGERYRQNVIVSQKWPMVKLRNIAEVISGQSPKGKFYNDYGEGTPFYQGKTEFTDKFIGPATKWTTQETKIAIKNDILMSVRAPVGPVNISTERICIGRGLAAIRPEKEKALYLYVYHQLKYLEDVIRGNSGSTFASINNKDIKNIKIPLPPLDVQQVLVDEIEGYQKVIDGARQVVESYKPVINIDPDWPLVKLGEVCEVKGGKRIPKGMSFSSQKTDYAYIRVSDFEDFGINTSKLKYIDEEVFGQIKRYTITSEDVYISIAGTIGIVGLIPQQLDGANLTENAAKLVIKDKEILDNEYLVYCLASEFVQQQIKSVTHAVGVPKLALFRIKDLSIPLAPIDKQRSIVDDLKQETQLVLSNKALTERFEAKIADRIKSMWEEG